MCVCVWHLLQAYLRPALEATRSESAVVVDLDHKRAGSTSRSREGQHQESQARGLPGQPRRLVVRSGGAMMMMMTTTTVAVIQIASWWLPSVCSHLISLSFFHLVWEETTNHYSDAELWLLIEAVKCCSVLMLPASPRWLRSAAWDYYNISVKASRWLW